MKILIVAEKSSVAKKIAAALCKNPKYYHGYIEDENFYITHCVGHLLTLKMPQDIDEKYKSWKIENLPFVFDKIPLEVNKNTKEQFVIVKGLLEKNDISEIVNACDPDREGELIFRNLFNSCKVKCKKNSRMWIETTGSTKALKETFENRKDGDLYIPLYKSAICRQYADYHIGLNSTMGMTSTLGNFKTMLSVGRVQTPTLNIIVGIEKQIRDFKPVKFWKIFAETEEGIDGNYFNSNLEDNRFYSQSDCQSVIDKTGLGQATVTDVLVSTRKDSPRLLFNLSDLQVEMNRKYKYSAQVVLDACQSLYERHGLTTYPRTSENKISQKFAEKVDMIVEGLPSIFEKQKNEIISKGYIINSKVVANNDSIGSHEALTPVPEAKIDEEKIKGLSTIELNVYKAIVERFLATFYPDAIFEKQEITFERNSSTFKNKIENLIGPGHYEAYESFKGKETEEFLKLKKDDIININNLEMVEGETQPPNRLSEGALLKIMMNPGKYVLDKEEKRILEETDGLGTVATRASIIEELKKKEYIKMEKDKIYPTEKGIHLIDIIPYEEIKSVSLTAIFEKKLSLIAKEEYDTEKFMNEIWKMEKNFIEKLKSIKDDSSLKFQTVKKSLCNCPSCDFQIIEGKYGWFCSNKDCSCRVPYDAYNHFGLKKVSETQAKELLTKFKTKKVAKLYSEKKQKNYEALLTYKYSKEEKYPNSFGIEFASNDSKKK